MQRGHHRPVTGLWSGNLCGISTHEPKSVWVRPHPDSWGKNINRSKDAPWAEESDIMLSFNGVSDQRFESTAYAFLRTACEWINGRDRAFPKYDPYNKVPFDVWWEKRGTQSAGKAFLFGWKDKAMARVFYVSFRNYLWSNDEFTSQVLVELSNDVFAKELERDFQYRWKANNRLLFVEESRAMCAIADANMTPPPPPPGRARDASGYQPPQFALPSPTAASSSARHTASEPSAKRSNTSGG